MEYMQVINHDMLTIFLDFEKTYNKISWDIHGTDYGDNGIQLGLDHNRDVFLQRNKCHEND